MELTSLDVDEDLTGDAIGKLVPSRGATGSNGDMAPPKVAILPAHLQRLPFDQVSHDDSFPVDIDYGWAHCSKYRQAFASSPAIKEAIRCRCATCQLKTGSNETHLMVVVYALTNQKCEVSMFDFPPGESTALSEYLNGVASTARARKAANAKHPPPGRSGQGGPGGSGAASSNAAPAPLSSSGGSHGHGRSNTTESFEGALEEEPGEKPASHSRRSSVANVPNSAPGHVRRLSVRQSTVEQVTYLASADLQQSTDPKGLMESAIKHINSGVWKDEFTGLDEVRQLSIWHPSTLLPNLSNIIQAINEHILHNLRSAVVKNGILCLQALFCTVAKHLEMELALLFPTLLRRASEGNQFLAGEAEVALRAAIMNLSPAKPLKVLMAIAKLSDDKSLPLRPKCMQCISWCIDQYGADIFADKQITELFTGLCQYLYDKQKETRAHAKQCLSSLFTNALPPGGGVGGVGMAVMQSLLDKIATPANVDRLKPILEQKGLGVFLDQIGHISRRFSGTPRSASRGFSPASSRGSSPPSSPRDSASQLTGFQRRNSMNNVNAGGNNVITLTGGGGGGGGGGATSGSGNGGVVSHIPVRRGSTTIPGFTSTTNGNGTVTGAASGPSALVRRPSLGASAAGRLGGIPAPLSSSTSSSSSSQSTLTRRGSVGPLGSGSGPGSVQSNSTATNTSAAAFASAAATATAKISDVTKKRRESQKINDVLTSSPAKGGSRINNASNVGPGTPGRTASRLSIGKTTGTPNKK